MLLLIAQQQPQIPAAYVTWLVPLVILGVMVQFGFGAIVSVVLFKMTASQRRYERLEDQRDHERDKRDVEIAELKRKVNLSEQERHLIVEKYVEKQLREMTHKIGNETNQVLLSLKEVRQQVHESLTELKQKMTEAEKQIDSLGEGRHKLEVETLERVMELKESVANKRDLQDHQKVMDEKLHHVHERINDLTNVAVTKDDMNRLLRESNRG